MIQLSSPLVFYLCAILLVSFEGIICPFLDFVIDNFGVADIYNKVDVEGPSQARRLALKKTKIADKFKKRVVLWSDILLDTITQEGSYPNVVSFYVRGESRKNYNIRFSSEAQARHFVASRTLSKNYRMTWARIYSNERPVIVSYDKLDDGDIGFKYLDNGDYANLDARLLQLPYIFRRSEIENEISTSTRPPQTLYLRSKKRMEDYEIIFKSTENLETFLKLFPNRKYDKQKTVGYYSIPCPGHDK